MTDDNSNTYSKAYSKPKANKTETRKKILGELESIRHLLTEEQRALAEEPPLLTDPAAPLLTEAIEDHELDDDWAAEDLKSIPVLEDSLDVAHERGDREQVDESPTESRAEDGDRVEDQPGLFDGTDLGAEPATSEDSAREPKQSSGTSQDTPSQEAAETASTYPKSENPFLPKHIRDRLQANRLMQQEMVKGFAMEARTLASTRPSATSDSPSSGGSEATVESRPSSPPEHLVHALVEDILQRHLPLMEAELREKLLELAKNSAESAADGEDSV